MPPVAAAEPMLPQLYPTQAQAHLCTSGLARQQQTARTQVTLTASSHTSPQSLPQQQQHTVHSQRSAPKTSAWSSFKQRHAQQIELCMLLFLCVLLSMLSNAGLLYVMVAQLDLCLHITSHVAKALDSFGSSITATCSQQAAAIAAHMAVAVNAMASRSQQAVTVAANMAAAVSARATCSQQAATMPAHMAAAAKAMVSSSQHAAKLWAFTKPCLPVMWQLATWFTMFIQPRLQWIWQLTVKALTMVTPALQWLGRQVGHLYRLIWAGLRRKKVCS